MKQRILATLLLLTLMTTPTIRPVELAPAITGITCGIAGAVLIGLWNLDLAPQNSVEKKQTDIASQSQIATWVRNHKQSILNATKIIVGGTALYFASYNLHPIIASIFKAAPRRKDGTRITPPAKPSERHISFFKYNSLEEIEKNWDAVKKQYRKDAIKLHPDKNPNNVDQAKKDFQQLSEHYTALEKYILAKAEYEKDLRENK